MKTRHLLFVLTILSLSFLSCRKGGPWGIRGKGATVTETRDLENFDKIQLSVEADLFYIQDSVYRVEITAQPNILAVLRAEVSGGTLKFDYRRNVWDHKDVKITVRSPEIRRLSISGSGDIEANGTITAERLELNISGSGDIDIFRVQAEQLKVSVSGSGDIHLAGGTVEEETFTLSGSGEVEADHLVSERAEASVSGSGKISLQAKERLEVTISGSGDIRYRGNPRITSRISGSGKLISLD
jgi:hypothetical protein